MDTPGAPSKTCTKCHIDKPLIDFYKDTKGRFGRHSQCKTCTLDARRLFYYQDGMDKIRQARTRLRVYGISSKEWETLFDSQGRKCAVCRIDTPNGHGWHTDHDHITGEVHGILCSSCNVGIGMFQDDYNLCLQAAAYLHSNLRGPLAQPQPEPTSPSVGTSC